METFDERVVVITGGASGIGLGLAQAFAREGARLVVADIEAGALDRATELLPDGTLAVQTDVSSCDEVERLAATTIERFGCVDVLCNNAGLSTCNLLWEQTLDDWRWVIDVNLWGVIHGVRAFLPIMREQGTHAHIVNTASGAALAGGVPYMAPYVVSKVGVVALSETLRDELAMEESPVKVSVLCPGFTNTNGMDGERNRPANSVAGVMTPDAAEVVRSIKESFTIPTVGMEPGEVADLVLQAVREERFWIITSSTVGPKFTARTDGVLDAIPAD